MTKLVHPSWLIFNLGDVVEGVPVETGTGIKFMILGKRKISDVVFFKCDLLDGGSF